MTDKRAEDLWTSFCSANPAVDRDTPYQVWFFGNTPEMARELADLVLAGRKTATAASLAMNQLQPEGAPQLGGYSVVTDYDGEPVCVIRTTEIRHLPFDEVDATFAAEEGEGDLSYEYWRRVHWDYFTQEAGQYGFEFDDTSIICCERFELLFSR